MSAYTFELSHRASCLNFATLLPSDHCLHTNEPNHALLTQSVAFSSILGASTRRTPAGVALDLFEQHQGTHILQSLDGFALAVAADGRFLYISETVSIYLGLSQVRYT